MNNIGTSEWWDSFLQDTDNLNKTHLFKGCLNGQTESLNHCILDTLTHLANKEGKSRLRVWVDGEINKETRQSIKSTPPQSGDDFLRWANRCFGNKKFGIILNACQNYSDELSRTFAEIFSPLIDKLGIPYAGLDLTFFLGNYGYTPIGLHQDPEGHKVIHFHLGPGNKEMYLIAPEVYEKEFPEPQNRTINYDEILPYATKYVIQPGDIFFMSSGQYHVGKSDEISAAITIWHREPSVNELQTEINSRLLDKIFSGEKKGIVPASNKFEGVQQILNELKPIISFDEEYKNLSVEGAFYGLIKDYDLELKSNAFMAGKVIPANDSCAIHKSMLVKGNAPFSIYYKLVSEDYVAFFIRGHRLLFPSNEGFGPFINQLNRWEETQVSKLIEPLLEEWEEEVAIELCELLLKYKAIEVCTSMEK